GAGRRDLRAHGEGVGRSDRRVDRRPGRTDLALRRGDPLPRALAHAPRLALDLREEPSMSEIPYRYEPDSSAAALHDEFNALAPGTETERVVTVAGRLMLRRVQGKLAFGTLQDVTGRIQLFATAQQTPEFERFCALSLGDWIGARGIVMTTKRGELSVRVGEWTVLAEAPRPFPDKWHGITDPDTKYRQRYVDLWVSDDVRHTFELRSRLVSFMRRWLEERGFVEVETPILQPLPGG